MDDGCVITAMVLTGDGGARELGHGDIAGWSAGDGVLWLHIDYTHPAAVDFLSGDCRLDPLVVDALTAESTQPRFHTSAGNLLLMLRGLNLNRGAELLDMISVRAWIEPQRIITARKFKVMAIDDIRNGLRAGKGPSTPESFLAQLCGNLTDRMELALEGMEDKEMQIEAQMLEGAPRNLRSAIGELRRNTISLRRYLGPQRMVLGGLAETELPWMSAEKRRLLREIAARASRDVEELDAIRDRAAIAQDELANHHAEQINRTMYMLSIVAAIFLPLGLLTGLLGINVKGIPGTENPYGFHIVCGLLVLIAAGQLWWFRRNRWL